MPLPQMCPTEGCGKPLVQGALYCPFCGRKLDSKAAPISVSEALALPVDVSPSKLSLAPDERYQIGRMLGEGAAAQVFLAYDRVLRRYVAIKILRRGFSEQRLRFEEESKVAAQIAHPGIVPVHDIGVLEDGRLYLTMKLLGKRTFQDLLDARACGSADIPLRRLLEIFLSVLHAVAFAHKKKVVHRDLKPANIVVDEQGEPIIVDWGVAKVLCGDAEPTSGDRLLDTLDGAIVGTAAFMAPEQIRGMVSKIDMRSDVYALGVILFNILTGKLPFQDKDEYKIMRRRLLEPAPAPSTVSATPIPAELESCCVKAMSERREDRYPSAAEFAEAVRDYLDGVAEAERRSRAIQLCLEEAKRAKSDLDRARREVLEKAKAFNSAAVRAFGLVALQGYNPTLRNRDEAAQALSESSLTRDQGFLRTDAALRSALSHDPNHPETRTLIADIYRDRLLDAERNVFDRADHLLLESQIRHFGSDRHLAFLKGDGSWTVATSPPGASVAINRFVDRDGLLVEEPLPNNESTPATFRLPMGSYVAIIRLDGFAGVRYPFVIRRLESAKASVVLLPDQEVEEGFAYIPTRSLFLPTDLTAPTIFRPFKTRGFCLSRYQITMAEYLEFINDLALEDPKAAESRTPRHPTTGQSYWVRTPEGRFELPTEPDAEGDIMLPRWPVTFISWNDADAYCKWRSAHDERTYRMPTDMEWEFAARGADARQWPFGNRFQPVANVGAGDGRPCAIDEFPSDCSPFGIFGMTGNAADYCQNNIARPPTFKIACGGFWCSGSGDARATIRKAGAPGAVVPHNSIRLVYVPKSLESIPDPPDPSMEWTCV